MSDEFNLESTPTLTFEPFKAEDSGAAAATAAAEAKPVAEAAADVQEVELTPEEQKMVDAFAEQIDVTNSALVMQYGAGAQQKVASFSEKALENVRSKDLGEVGNMISDVVVDLKSFDVNEDDKGILGLFKKNANKIQSMKARYAKVETNINTISDKLENHQVTLLKDVATLDQLYEVNMNYYKELSMYILAGKQKLKKIEEEDIPALTKKAQESGSQADAQAVSDMTALANRFEKKIHDLELTRIISMQMAPQIRLIQNNDVLMADKIQSTLVNTIPLWKNQMVLALGLEDSTKAARAESEVTEMTNKLLLSNAEKLKQTTIATAKASERGIVDMETLKKTNASLIETLDEVSKIQTEGRAARARAEVDLRNMEDELKRKLLNMQSDAAGEAEKPAAPEITPVIDLNAAPDKAPWEK